MRTTDRRISRKAGITSAACLSRRAFLHRGSLYLAGAACAAPFVPDALAAAVQEPQLRFGIITDLHYADKPTAISRYYRETPGKLAEAIEHLEQVQPQFVVELGDLIDQAAEVAAEIRFLKTIDRQFQSLRCPKHYVLGNHCVGTLTKEEFCDNSGSPAPHYSFDSQGCHFVILDACFRADLTPYQRNNFDWKDANIPPAQLEWLADDLRRTKLPTIVFAHQRLDEESNHAVKNAADVRRILEQPERVQAVFQGHNHKNDHREIGGVHYVTLAAMVQGSGPDNNAYTVAEVYPGGLIRLAGYRQHQNRELD